MKRFVIMVMGALMVLGLLVIAPVARTPISEPTAVAQAGECSYGMCGNVKNVSNGLYLRVTGDWSDKQPNALVAAGSWAPYVDDDGFYVPAYYDAYVVSGGIGFWATATGWHKVGDNYNTYYVSLRKQ